MTAIQVILITVLAFLEPIDDFGYELHADNKTFWGFAAGIIMGDMVTGLIVGSTCQLVSLGVMAIGGSTVPNWKLAAIIGTVYAITTGEGASAGIMIGSLVGLLYVQLEMLHHVLAVPIAKLAESYCDKREYRKMELTILSSTILLGLCAAIPTLILCLVGIDAISTVTAMMPDWVNTGLNIASGMMPAIGMALLLNYMPAKKYFGCLLVGFALSAFAGWQIMPITLVGAAWGLEKYHALTNKTAVAVGGAEDE